MREVFYKIRWCIVPYFFREECAWLFLYHDDPRIDYLGSDIFSVILK